MRKRLFYFLLVLMIFFQTQLAMAQAGRTTKEQTTAQPQFINPSGLSKPNGYTHVVIVQPERLVNTTDGTGRRIAKADLHRLLRYEMIPHAKSDAINYRYRNERACLRSIRAKVC